MKRAWAVLLVFVPPVASADQVFLKSGGRITGAIVERTEKSIALDVGPGRITMPLSSVERVVEGLSDIATYRQRAERLGPADLEGWLALAAWAREHDLYTQSREACERVLAADPQNAPAHRALGDILLGDRWVSLEESYRAHGYVSFDGQWVTPQEREVILRERAEADAAERARAESDARLREVEARARAAEADAQRASANALPPGSLPLYPPYGV